MSAAVEFRGKVRDRDPETSWDAAALQTSDKLDRREADILALLAEHGEMSDEQLYDRCTAFYDANPTTPRSTPQAVRTSRHALVLKGRIKDTGRRAPTRSGSTAAIWTVAQ